MADAIEVRVMVAADRPGVEKLIEESFLQDSPLRKALRVEVPRETNAWTHKLVSDYGANGLATVAVDKTNDAIVGVQLGTILTRDTDFGYQESSVDPVQATIDKILKSLYKSVDIFAAYGVDEYVHLKVLNVRREYRNRGIATRLIDLATEVARALSYKLFAVGVTAKYSMRLFEKLDYDVLSEVMFDNYTDEKGRRVLGDTGGKSMLMAKFYN